MAKDPLINPRLIKKLVADDLPKTAEGRINLRSVGDMTVVEVVTDAWKSRPRLERITKVDAALRKGLNEAEQNKILRISVLTSSEQSEFARLHPRTSKSLRARSKSFVIKRRSPANGTPAKTGAKRTTVR